MGVLRFVLRFMLGTLILLGLALIAIWVFRAPLTQWVIADGLRRAGYEDAQFEVSSLSSSQLQLQQVRIGTGVNGTGVNGTAPIIIDQIDIGFDWRTLLTQNRITTLTIGPGRVHATLTEAGALEIPGLALPGNNQDPNARSAFDPANLPLDAIKILPISLALETPRGVATGLVQGHYDRQGGGLLKGDIQSDGAGLERVFVAPGMGRIEIDLSPDGNFSMNGNLKGRVETDYGAADDLGIEWDVRGASWISILDQDIDDVSLEGVVDLQSLTFALKEDIFASSALRSSVESFNAIISSETPASAVGAIAFSGALRVAFEKGKMSAYPVEGRPLSMRSDGGDEIYLRGVDALPFVSQTDRGRQFSFFTSVKSRWLSLTSQLSGEQTGTDQLNAAGWVRLPTQQLDLMDGQARMLIDTLAIEFSGNQTGDRYFAQTMMTGEIAAIDRAPMSMRRIKLDRNMLAFNFLPNAPTGIAPLVIRGVHPQDQVPEQVQGKRKGSKPCLDIGEVSVSLDPEDLATKLAKIELCANGQPLLEVTTLSPLRFDLHVKAKADTIRYRHGDATLNGQPPRTDLDGRWDSVEDQLILIGSFAGGNVVLNQALRLSDAKGEIRAQIIGEQLSAQTSLSKIRIDQATRPVMVAPILASGALTYSNDRAKFNAAITTVDNNKLGTASGVHDLSIGTGQLAFDIAPLTFLPDGLQPVQILPALAGIIANATGEVTGTANFDWSTNEDDQENPLDLGSSATLIARDLTFTGPGRAVSATGGVNGTVQFVDLLPAKSNGVQTIELGFVDLDAIRLENGVMRVEFPGDDSVRVIEGVFPWFGGTLGAYDTLADLTGEKVTTALRAADIDLGAFLAFMDIPGLTGEGTVAGTVPIIVDDGKIRVENAVLRATTPGVIRFDSSITRELAKTSRESQLAFDVLRELTFETFEATISGALDGQLRVGLVFEGVNVITIGDERVRAPVIYRITLQGPLPNLLSQRMQFSDFSFSPAPG